MVNNWFQSLTPQGRTIVAVIVAAVSSVALFFITKVIVKAVNKAKEGKNPQQVVDDADKDLKAEQQNGAVLSHPASAYTGAANAIEKLLDGCETFESELQVLGEIVSVVNKPIDWFQLVQVFDKREIETCGTFGLGSSTYDLISLLKDQMDSSGYYKIEMNGYKNSGFVFMMLTPLREFLKTKGVSI